MTTIQTQPHFSFLTEYASNLPDLEKQEAPEGAIFLNEGEYLQVESAGMLASKNLTLSTSLSDQSYYEIFKNYFIGGENLFFNKFTAGVGGGWILLEETHPHQIMSYTLNKDEGVCLMQGTYLASSGNVNLKTEFVGLGGYLKGKGISTVLAKLNTDAADKTGKVFFNSVNGPIKCIRVKEGETITVDNEALVAYTQGLKCKLTRPGHSTFSLLMSGEGFVCEFEGDGYVFTGSDEISGRMNTLYNAGEAGGHAAGQQIIQLTVMGIILGSAYLTSVYLNGFEKTHETMGDIFEAWLRAH